MTTSYTDKARAAASVAISIMVSTSVDVAPASAKAVTAAPSAPADDLVQQLYSKSAGPAGGSSRLAGTETAR